MYNNRERKPGPDLLREESDLHIRSPLADCASYRLVLSLLICTFAVCPAAIDLHPSSIHAFTSPIFSRSNLPFNLPLDLPFNLHSTCISPESSIPHIVLPTTNNFPRGRINRNHKNHSDHMNHTCLPARWAPLLAGRPAHRSFSEGGVQTIARRHAAIRSVPHHIQHTILPTTNNQKRSWLHMEN